MKLVGMTQRVAVDGPHQERRDALDQRWIEFVDACGFVPVLIPNNEIVAQNIISEIPISGLIFTGGNDLSSLGGDAHERDSTERLLLDWAISNKKPVLGVCRGMQVIQEFFGTSLIPVEGHVAAEQEIEFEGNRIVVNSYHRWGSIETPNGFHCLGNADDGVVKAIKHESLPIMGIMWHPERFADFRAHDISLVRDFLGQ